MHTVIFKKIRLILVSAAVITACLSPVIFSPALMADDTEIYTNSSIVPGEPFVMFMLDYRANLNSTATCDVVCKKFLGLTGTSFTRFDILRAVIAKVMAPINNMKVGFMMTHQHNQNCAGPNKSKCSNGAFIVSGFKSMSDAAQKTDFQNKINAVPNPTGGTSHSYQGKEMMFEFFRYLTGQEVYNGHLGYKDYGDTSNLTMDSVRDLSIEIDPGTGVTNTDPHTPGRYVSPLDATADRCAKIFTINFMFGVTQQEDDSDSAITATKANGGMEGIDFATHHSMGHSGSGNTLNNVVNWMSNIDDLADGTWGTCPNVAGKQKVTSFYVTEGSHLTADTYANAGGTTEAYSWSDDPFALVDTLNSMIAEILSTSTTFTAASVPVSVLNRAQIVDNIYIALFQADELGRARWPGNIKKLKLDSTGSILVDTSGNNAIATDGRIKHEALTYWTVSAALPPADTSKNEVPFKDGRAVMRGGVGQKVPGFIGGNPGATNATTGARQLYYEPASNGALLSSAPLNADSATATALQTALGAADSATALELLKFARGYDVTDDDGDNVVDEARDWILGDSLHSRPIPINYGNSNANNDPDIRLLMGTNDGFMHMFKNTDPATTGTQLGTEVWAYMPTAVMGVINTLKSNHVIDHPYGVDGAPAAYLHDDDNDGVIETPDDKVWLFFGLRRGGKAYYGLDISDPDAPKKLWTIDKSTTGFGELGMTFSQPRVAKMDWGSGVKPVILFGGGYDANKDTRKSASPADSDYIHAAMGTDDSEGNAIYIVDAETGTLIWKAVYGATAGYDSSKKAYSNPDLKDSIPSTLTVADTDSDKKVDRIYVGDTGGNVWRADMAGNDPSTWTLVKLANLGRHYNSSEEDDRRFFHRPDFVKYKDASGAYDAVIIGSGDRAHPLDTKRNNWVYMIKDRFITAGTPPTSVLSHSDLGDVTDNCLQDGGCSPVPDLAYGWRLKLEQSGEKSLATMTTINKQIYFTSYTPADQAAIAAALSCEPSEGTGRLYAVGLEDARAVNDYAVSNGTTIAKVDRYVDLKSGGIPAEVVYIPFNKVLKPDLTVQEVSTAARWKTYWYPEED